MSGAISTAPISSLSSPLWKLGEWYRGAPPRAGVIILKMILEWVSADD